MLSLALCRKWVQQKVLGRLPQHMQQRLNGAKTAAQRGRILRRWFELMLENQDDLALLMTLEQGKP